jgi:O-methyltransferase
VEVGTFTGYATLCLARAVGAGGRVVTCDITSRWPDIGKPYWAAAGVADRIDTRIGPATETLAELPDASADFVFVDADKVSYERYYEHALRLVRPEGLIAVDNTLYFGRVVDRAAQDPDTVAIRAFNAARATDDRIEISLLPVADGLTLIRRK